MKITDSRWNRHGDFGCPHCQTQYDDDDSFFYAYSPTTFDGQRVVDCLNCGKPFLVKWFVEVHYETSAELPPPAPPAEPPRRPRVIVFNGDGALEIVDGHAQPVSMREVFGAQLEPQ